MYRLETVIAKLKSPTTNKRNALADLQMRFTTSVGIALSHAEQLKTSSRKRIHDAAYHQIRADVGIASDYTRMAVNDAVALARSYYGLRKSKTQKRTTFPTVSKQQSIGLGVNAYKVIERDSFHVLRVSTGKRGQYLWLPLCVAERYAPKMQYVKGDAKLFQKRGNWFVMLPLKIPSAPTARSGDCQVIGVDTGIVRIATVYAPDTVRIFDGKAIRHRREHFADIRRRYAKAKRLDKLRQQKGKEQRWMRDINHKISAEIIAIADQYPNPVIVLEKLDGIRDRARGSKRFNRMLSSWAFRQLKDMLEYKAHRLGIRVEYVDPRNTSKRCNKCGHTTRSNRPNQSSFRCVNCGYRVNADVNAAKNIAAKWLNASEQERLDTAPSNVGADSIESQLDKNIDS